VGTWALRDLGEEPLPPPIPLVQQQEPLPLVAPGPEGNGP